LTHAVAAGEFSIVCLCEMRFFFQISKIPSMLCWVHLGGISCYLWLLFRWVCSKIGEAPKSV
jgi:hypothetical protein